METFLKERVIPVVIIDNVEDSVALARALCAGGLHTMELTLRTPAAEACIAAIKKNVPEMKVGVGTVLSVQQVDRVVELGGSFAVAPGFNPKIVRHAQTRGLPFAPGVMTPTDVELALELGCKVQKFFPASVAGGLEMLKALAGPYAHTGIKFIPLGGVNAQNMADYLSLPVVGAIGGSWLADKKMIAEKNWAGITGLAAAAVEIASKLQTKK
jgi:2-dehydro-3-deoxyphosphogluconate aldolase/(4S)-4-hydroxy-2-oxoglutarate aldolase